MARTLEYNATLAAKVEVTPVLAIFEVVPDTPIPAGRWFIPGQYVTLGLNNEVDPDKGSVRRAMSIASAPQQRETIDFYVRYVDEPGSDNPLTHLLWELKPGDRLYMTSRPIGKFTIDDTIGTEDERLKILVAAGTGLAPFTAMIEAVIAEDPKADLSEFVLLHGASYPDQLGYKARLEQLACDNSLHYIPTVSRPEEAPDWTGETGRVEDLFEPARLDALEQAIGREPGYLTPETTVIYICGLTGTIAKTIERLLGRGFVPSHRRLRRALGFGREVESTIYYEQYDNEPVFRVKDPGELARLEALLPAS